MNTSGGLPSMGSHRVGHDWSDLAAEAASHIDRLINTLNNGVEKMHVHTCLLSIQHTWRFFIELRHYLFIFNSRIIYSCSRLSNTSFLGNSYISLSEKCSNVVAFLLKWYKSSGFWSYYYCLRLDRFSWATVLLRNNRYYWLSQRL